MVIECDVIVTSFWGPLIWILPQAPNFEYPPLVTDICDVAKSDVVLKLPSPQTSEETLRAKRQLSFSVDLTAYKNFLC